MSQNKGNKQAQLKVIKNSNDTEIIHSVVSILGNISQQNGILLIENNIFKYLLLLCQPNTDINTLIIISQIISNVCKYKELTNENINQIIKCLSVLIMYDISDILTSTIYSYNQIFTYFVLPNHQQKIDMKIILNGGVNKNVLKQQIEERSNKDEMLVIGCIKQWDIKQIPIVINAVIVGFLTPFGMQQVKCMKFNKIERFVGLLTHKCNKIISFDLILLCCIIASAKKYNYIGGTLNNIINFGVIGYLKYIYNGKCIENDQRCLMLICAIIEYGNEKIIKLLMETEILFPFMSKVIIKQIIDNYTQNCVLNALKKVLNVYKKYYNVDVLYLIENEINKLKINKYVMD
eukprot:82766_1